MQRMINTHVEASKIGRQIAEQVLDSLKQGGELSPPSSPDRDPVTSGEVRANSIVISCFPMVL